MTKHHLSNKKSEFRNQCPHLFIYTSRFSALCK
ncbi:MAG: hypothetical protein HYR67_07705 [Bacteroidetes bacterium]|nr:hypothetical protein [Bacteroidota bacterium]